MRFSAGCFLGVGLLRVLVLRLASLEMFYDLLEHGPPRTVFVVSREQDAAYDNAAKLCHHVRGKYYEHDVASSRGFSWTPWQTTI